MNTTCARADHLVHQFAPLLGRLLMAALFVPAGLHKITGFATTAAMMAAKGLPLSEVLLVLTIAIELGGGLMLLLGWHARAAAVALFLFMIPVTLVFHGFWNIADAQAQGMQQIMFMKNIAIMGGLAFIAAFGSGAFGLSRSR